MFLKEHEKYLPVHAMIQASAAKPKTPYQLDLEVKDRKPGIIPKVGDRVKIKSLKWYEKWKDEDENVNFSSLHHYFSQYMKKYCGTIVRISKDFGSGLEIHEDYKAFVWQPEFFEEVYPVQEQLSSKFPRIDLSGAIQPLPNCLGGEMVLSKEEQERLKKQLREKWGVKPKLKQVKTTHLIKLKKL